MKKIIFLMGLMMVSLTLYAQKAGGISSSNNVPFVKNDPNVLIGSLPNPSGMFEVYIKDSIYWQTYNVIGLDSILGTKISGADTTSLSNRIDAKLSANDTISLSNRIDKKLSGADTISLSNRIDAIPAQVNSDWNSTSGKSQILNKPTLATVATTGNYSDLNGKPTIKRQETYSGTTNASGVYTVTFSTPYSVAPNVQASITNQSSTLQEIRVSAVSTTGFTINVYQRNTSFLSLLGLDVLTTGTSNVNGATVDVLVTEK